MVHAFTAQWEGGLTDHPADPGGLTNYGVSLRWVQDLARQARQECLRQHKTCDDCPNARTASCAYCGLDLDMAPALSLADGIDALRRQLPRFWFDAAACARGLKALRAYRRRWRAGAAQGEQAGSGPLHDWASHAADALRYAVTGFRPQQEVAPGARRARTNYDFFGGN